MEMRGICSFLLFLCPLLMRTAQLSLCFPTLSPGGGNETDRLSLLAFKAQILDDPQNVLPSWNESLHFCDWSGVTCERRHRRVVVLDLNSRQLKGTLPPHTGNLSFLRIIDLSNNKINRDIPVEIGQLFRLEFLDLSYNKFNGRIPESISLCSGLIGLALGGNNFTGKLPAELGSLSRLQILVFQNNNPPSSIGNLSSLKFSRGQMDMKDVGSQLQRIKRGILRKGSDGRA